MSRQNYIAFDLGAESGRVMLGTVDEMRLTLEEVHRFSNGPVNILKSRRWDVLRIFEELKTGLMKASRRNIPITSISTDSWGVDYVLLRSCEPFLTAPYHYRDDRTDGWAKKAAKKMSREAIYNETGIQFMELNTLFQLLAHQKQDKKLLKQAERFLNIGDYFNYLFSGVKMAEESLASTTQMYNPQTRKWSEKLVAGFKLPYEIFPDIVPSGTVLGPLVDEIAKETGLQLQTTKVVASCSHDTGAAVAAVPAAHGSWAYLSSGTWSLMGLELPKPIINDNVLAYNFTNEAGYGGTTRFLKNLIGLWILQECRRSWEQAGQSYDYASLVQQAAAAPAFGALINPNDARFAKPGEMPEKIAKFCKETKQEAPQTPGAITRCILESLAFLYRQTLEQLEQVSLRKVEVLHIVGGGSKNELLNQFAANALNIPVVAGPDEATATGNILIQAIASGQLSSLMQLREVVRNSFSPKTYHPEHSDSWSRAYMKFKEIVKD